MSKKIVYFAMLVILLAPTVSLARQSRVESVTVYADRAMVTRNAEVTLTEGDVSLVFTGLPASLDDNSLQVWGVGSAKAVLEGISLEMDPPPAVPEGKVAELENKLTELSDNKKLLENKRKACDARILLLTGVKPELPQDPSSIKLGDFSEITRIIEAVITGLRSVYAEQRALNAQIRKLNNEIKALEIELARIKNPSGTRTKQVTIALTVKSAGKMTVMISYVVPNAGWRALYDIRALPDDGKVEITGFAEIIQKTGEDWENVNLAVSTAKPHIWGEAPKVNPIYLVFYAPPPPAPPPPTFYNKALPLSIPESTATDIETESEEGVEETEAVTEISTVKSEGTSAFFEVKQAKTILSNGEAHRVSITFDSISAEFIHASWPEGMPAAFLKAKMTNLTGHPFVAGKAKVFLGASYIGETAMQVWSPTAEMSLSLGVDQGVKVERKLLNKMEKESGGKRVFNYEYRVKVSNFKPKTIKLELYDRIPYSHDADLEIKLEKINPAPVEQKENGIIKWEFSVAQGAEVEAVFSYTVRFPKNREVIGLQ